MSEVETVLKLAAAPGALFLLVIYLYLQFADLRRLVTEIRDAIPSCQKERRTVEADMHDRITQTQTSVANLQGRMNGVKT